MENTPNPFVSLPSVLGDALAEQPVSYRHLQDTDEYGTARSEGFRPLSGEVLSASEMYALYAAFLENVQSARMHSGVEDL